MKITIKEEQGLLILLSVIELGGSAPKSNVLDHIYNRKYLNLKARDLENCNTLAEEKWRNDLAWTRRHLVVLGYLESEIRDCWMITQDGLDYFNDLASNLSFDITRLISKSGFESIRAQLQTVAE